MTTLAFVIWWIYQYHRHMKGGLYDRYVESLQETLELVKGATLILV